MKAIELARLYVDQRVKGTGYGAALMQACLDEAHRKGYHTMWLGVWKRNAHALRFYAKWGFQKVGTKTFTVGSDVQHDHVLARPVDGG